MHLDPPDLPGYRVGRRLGGGGDGEVWLAWPLGPDGALEPAVALKRRVGPGRGPVGAAALLPAHPNLLPVLDVRTVGEHVVSVLPFLPGGTLADLLAERGALPPGAVAAVLGAVAAGIAALHEVGLVHGDLKPTNVLLDADGTPVVGDVDGLRHEAAAGPRSRPVGTLGYLAPEVASGEALAPGAAADTYAMGVVAYECLTGARPYRGTSTQVLAASATGARRPLAAWASIPDPLAEVVERALAVDPGARPTDPCAWAAEVAAVAGEEVELPGPAARPAVGPAGWPDSGTTIAVGPDAPHHGSRVPGADGDGGERAGRHRWGPWVRTVRAGCIAARRRPAVALVAVVAVAGAATLVVGRSGRPGPSVGAGPPPAVASDPVPCPVRPDAGVDGDGDADVDAEGDGPLPEAGDVSDVGDVGGATEVLVAILDPGGCGAEVVWRHGVLHVPDHGTDRVRRYAIGEVGDQVVFGDWDGDGVDAPALYRRSIGEVQYLDRLPTEVGQQSSPVRVEPADRGGTAYVVPLGDRGRETVIVEP